MNLEELQSARDRERRTDKLQELRDSFYADADEFLRQLRRERERAAERADDPFDAPEVTRLTDEIDTAEGTVEAVFQRRIGKLVKAASLAAADQPIDTDGMTAEERALFEEMVGEIEATRERVLGDVGVASDPEEGAGGTEPASTPAPEGAATDGTDAADGTDEAPDRSGADRDQVDAADLMGGGTDTGAESGPPTSAEGGREEGPESEADVGAGSEETPVGDGGGTASVERATVRVTADVGSILGVDSREYDLAAEDVVVLPADNADPLVERGAAERLD